MDSSNKFPYCQPVLSCTPPVIYQPRTASTICGYYSSGSKSKPRKGKKGDRGPKGDPCFTNVSSFYIPEGPVVVEAGDPVIFPEESIGTGMITTTGGGVFVFPKVGLYEISFQIIVDDAAQFIATLNDEILPYTLSGSSGNLGQVVGMFIIETMVKNSLFSIINPLLNDTQITINPAPGDNFLPPVSSLIIKQLNTPC